MSSYLADQATQIPEGVADSTALYPRRWAAAIVMVVAALMDLIDGTIVNVALPTLQRDLHASATQVEWTVSAYLLAFAATLITAGRLGDIVGRKRMFLGGVAAFGTASLLCAVAQSPGWLIGARTLQGVAAATIVPQVLATFRSIFEGKERGAAFALYGAMAGTASALGLIVGGALTGADILGWGWRTIFVVNVPVALAVLAAAAVLVPESRERAARRPDLLGAGILVAAVVAIVYPLLEGRRLGWPAWGWALLAVGILAIVVLGVVDAKRRHGDVAPLLPTRLFRYPAFAAGVLVQMIFFGTMIGFVLTMTLWLQSGQGFSPMHSGLTMVSFSVGALLTAGVSISLAPRFGRYVLAAGAVLMAAGTVGCDIAAHHVGDQVSSWALVPGLTLGGAGLGLLVVPLVNVVLAAVPTEEGGEASGVFSTAQQLGGALGVAIIGTIFFDRLAGHGFTAAFTHAAPFAAGGYVLCALLSLLLPSTAVEEAY